MLTYFPENYRVQCELREHTYAEFKFVTSPIIGSYETEVGKLAIACDKRPFLQWMMNESFQNSKFSTFRFARLDKPKRIFFFLLLEKSFYSIFQQKSAPPSEGLHFSNSNVKTFVQKRNSVWFIAGWKGNRQSKGWKQKYTDWLISARRGRSRTLAISGRGLPGTPGQEM